MDLSLAEKQLNAYLDRASAKSGEARAGQFAANEEEARQRAVDERRGDAARLVNATAWSEYYGALALRHHDLAAENAAKRDEYAAIVRELQRTNERKSA